MTNDNALIQRVHDWKESEQGGDEPKDQGSIKTQIAYMDQTSKEGDM